MRRALLIKLEVGEHFNASRKAGSGILGQNHGIAQNAIYAIAHQHFILFRFYMDVRGVLDNGVFKQSIDNAHHRQISRQFFKLILGNVITAHFVLNCLKRISFLLDNIAKFGFKRFLIGEQGPLHGFIIRQTR